MNVDNQHVINTLLCKYKDIAIYEIIEMWDGVSIVSINYFQIPAKGFAIKVKVSIKFLIEKNLLKCSSPADEVTNPSTKLDADENIVAQNCYPPGVTEYTEHLRCRML